LPLFISLEELVELVEPKDQESRGGAADWSDACGVSWTRLILVSDWQREGGQLTLSCSWFLGVMILLHDFLSNFITLVHDAAPGLRHVLYALLALAAIQMEFTHS